MPRHIVYGGIKVLCVAIDPSDQLCHLKLLIDQADVPAFEEGRQGGGVGWHVYYFDKVCVHLPDSFTEQERSNSFSPEFRFYCNLGQISRLSVKYTVTYQLS